MAERRPTIIDVARAAGVSKSTVSLVLQNSTQVRDETRIHVRKVMESIGYVYNRSAATLRNANTGLIGLVINDLRNPFFTEFATSFQMEMSSRGYATVVANTDEDPALQSQVVSAMIEHGVSAFVVSPAYGEEQATFDMIARAAIPTIQVLRRVVADGAAFPFAAPDYQAGSRRATEHLLEVGCKQIAFVGGLEGRAVTNERMSGYLDAVRLAGMAPTTILGRSSRSFGRDVAIKLAETHPGIDGAVCFNDLVGLGMSAGFAQIGRKVGAAGFKIVGFDDIEECAQTYPALTTIRCDVDGFGRQVADIVLDWLKGGVQPPAEMRTSVELIVRDSTLHQS